jgi:hypothetical protein
MPLKLKDFNKDVKTLLIQSPPESLPIDVQIDAKIAGEDLTSKIIEYKKDDKMQKIQIFEILVAVEGHKPFKASVLSESHEDFANRTKGDDVKIIIKTSKGKNDKTYKNAEI